MHNLNINSIKALAESPEFAQLAANIISSKAVAQITVERVSPLLKIAFDHFDFKYGNKTPEKGKRIKNPRHLFLCDDEGMCAEYYASCDAAYIEAGYHMKPGYSPILVAEHKHLKAEWAFLKYVDEKLGTNFYECYGIGGVDRKEALKLCMGLAINNPLAGKLAKEQLPINLAACADYLGRTNHHLTRYVKTLKKNLSFFR